MAVSLEPLRTHDAHAYWEIFVSGRGDLPTRDLKIHLDRYLALPPEEQRAHFEIRKGGRIIGAVRLGPGEISGFSMDPAHASDTRTALVKAVDFVRARAAVPDGVRLVPPEEAEIARLTDFLVAVYEGHIEQAYGLHAGSAEEWQDYVGGLLKGDSGRFMPDASYVNLEGPRIAGAILVTHWMGMPLVAELGVAKDRRGKGIGRALLQAAMNRLEGLGEPRLALYVTVGNDPAVALYQSMGFLQVGGQSVTARLDG